MPDPVTDPVADSIADRFLRNLQWGVLGVTVAVTVLLDAATIVEFAGDYRPLWLEVAAWVALTGVAVTAAVRIARRRPWGRLRLPLLVLAAAAAVAGTSATQPAGLIGPPHWSWETVGWYAVLLMLDQPVHRVAAILAVLVAVTALQVVAAGRGDVATVAAMTTVALVVGGWQVAVAFVAGALRRISVVARDAARDYADVRHAAAAAERVHQDRRARYQDLAATTLPLLRDLGDDRLDPQDAAVQQRCAVEAARVRRLLAESDEHDSPLEHEVRACIEAAERRGVAVTLAVRGRIPPVPVRVRRALTEPAIDVLATAVGTARVTVVGLADRVTVSTMAGESDAVAAARTGQRSRPASGAAAVRVTRVIADRRVWVAASWTR